jgi:hypothetical protein
MKEQYCEKEQEVAAAASGGSCDAAILGHARNCRVCSEVLLVAKFLLEGTQLAAHEVNSLPDAIVVWRKAQALAREKALVRATLPIRAARIVAFCVGAVVAPLLILNSRRLWPWIPDLWPGQVLSTNRPWPAGFNASLLLLTITGAIIFIGLSSWYMLREE